MKTERSSIVSNSTKRREKDYIFSSRILRIKASRKDTNGPSTERLREIFTVSAMYQVLAAIKGLRDSTPQIDTWMQLSTNPGSSNP